MSQTGRLVALRLQGFKSFADRTLVEFAPGINAVVGPNGSGKSNLADALRWTLGEQGRAIRSRRSEDVVFAGSERRSALGMADVSLVLDNADGLIPLDFVQLELGRRLYRSGENDYLVNRQRVRLRDLVDLLDAAHLAENAFLFIGQGMVDQALALRPEERRPLFEEVAGVRRHERRRRKAEEQLEEASANLARVDDVLGELRPQARRLATQAEQHVTRARAGEELAAAIVTRLGTRWHAVASAQRHADRELATARRAAALALDALQNAENGAADAARALSARANAEQAARADHETARSALAVLQLDAARASAEAAGIARDRDRLATERAAAEAELSARRRELALPLPEPDPSLEQELEELERALAEASGEAQALLAATAARSEAESALRRAAHARAAEVDGIRRRLAETDRRLGEAQAAAESTARRATELEAAAEDARERARAVRAARAAAAGARDAARAVAATAEAARLTEADAAASAGARAATLRGRLQALEARLAEDETRGIGRAARRLGGRALATGLDVEPSLRVAVSAALGELAGAFVVRHADVPALAEERGIVVLDEAAGPGAAAPAPAEIAAVRGAVARVGGGLLADAVRADGAAAASRLIARCAWVPALADALAIAGKLPPGWSVATRTGAVVTAAGSVRLGIADAPLERRAEAEAVRRDLEAAEAERVDADGRLAHAHAAAEAARAADAEARAAEGDAASRVRSTEEAERRATRDAEQAAREAGWAASRLAVIAAERAALADRLGALTRPDGAAGTAPASEVNRATEADGVPVDAGGARAAWEARAADLRVRRDRLAADRAELDARRRAAEGRRARAEAAAMLAEERIARADAEAAALAVRDEALVALRGVARAGAGRGERARGSRSWGPGPLPRRRCSGPRAAPAGRDGSRRGS